MVLRLTIGSVYLMHGYVSLLQVSSLAGLLIRLGCPASLAPALTWYLIIAHLAGGAFIVLGLFTRWAALANVPIMATAVLRLHLRQGFFLTATVVAGGRAAVIGGYEFALSLLGATIALALLGSGALALDGARR
jgi:putative oxidoreductase